MDGIVTAYKTNENEIINTIKKIRTSGSYLGTQGLINPLNAIPGQSYRLNGFFNYSGEARYGIYYKSIFSFIKNFKSI